MDSALSNRDQETQQAWPRHQQAKLEQAENLSRTSGIPKEVSAKTALAQMVVGMSGVADPENFTGQLTAEVHCKEGVIKDVYLSSRRKLAD